MSLTNVTNTTRSTIPRVFEGSKTVPFTIDDFYTMFRFAVTAFWFTLSGLFCLTLFSFALWCVILAVAIICEYYGRVGTTVTQRIKDSRRYYAIEPTPAGKADTERSSLISRRSTQEWQEKNGYTM